jgi:hypothetical protein
MGCGGEGGEGEGRAERGVMQGEGNDASISSLSLSFARFQSQERTLRCVSLRDAYPLKSSKGKR